MITRNLSIPLSLMVLTTLMVVPGCGKGANTDLPLLEFPNALPLAPRALTKTTPAWTAGHPIAVTDDEIHVVDRDNGNLVVMNRQTMAVSRTVFIGDEPEQIVVGPEGDSWISVRRGGYIVHLAPGADTVEDSDIIDVGFEPYGLALSVDGATLYASVRGSNELVVIDADTHEELQRHPTLDAPRSIVVTNRSRVAVAHEAASLRQFTIAGDGTLTTAIVDTPMRRGTNVDAFLEDQLFQSRRTNGMQTTRAMALVAHPESGHVHVAHHQATPGVANMDEFRVVKRDDLDQDADPVPSDGYGSGGSTTQTFEFLPPVRPVELGVTTVKEDGGSKVAEPSFPVQDSVTGEAITALVAQPSDFTHHPTQTLAFITSQGSDLVAVLNTAHADPLANPVAVIDVGMAPRGVGFSPDGQHAYVLNSHSFTVSEINLAPFFSMKTRVQKVTDPNRDEDFDDFGLVKMANFSGDNTSLKNADQPLFTKPLHLGHQREATYGEDPASPEVRRGRRVFTFARNGRLSHQGQLACATCHLEGMEDKLVWITDGPRQTMSLAGRVANTGPFNWLGSRGELKENMEQTVTRMGGGGLTNSELADLEAFLINGLQAPVNPFLETLDEVEVQEGKELFEQKCASCHTGDKFTDGQTWNVNTANDAELFTREELIAQGHELPPPGFFNTPSLRDIWYTAPYLHSGSAVTLMDVLDQTAATKMELTGQDWDLDAGQKQALISYLLTL